MKKLYAFQASLTMLLALVALGIVSSGALRAQSYTSTSYLVHKIDVPDAQGLGSGPNWTPLSGGTVDATGELPYYTGEYGDYGGTGHPLPFNVRFGNVQLTTANSWHFTCDGSVIMSPTWGQTWYYYPFDGYNFKEVETYGTAVGVDFYNYAYPECLVNSEYNGGSYGEFPNYFLMPFDVGYELYGYIPQETNPTVFKYNVLGSAPNRELVCEVDNMHTGYDWSGAYPANPSTYVSFQTVVYESGISQFQFNYSPTTGSDPFHYDVTYTGCPFTYGVYKFPGSWDLAYCYNEGSYALVEDYAGMCGMKLTSNNYLMIDFNGNGWNASNQFVVGYNTPYGSNGSPLMCDTAAKLPQSSIRMFIAFPYDFTASAISVPINENPYTLYQPLSYTVAGNTFTGNGSAYTTGTDVVFTTTGAMPSPLVAGAVYYVTNATNILGVNTFQVLTTPVGAANYTVTAASPGVFTSLATPTTNGYPVGTPVRFTNVGGTLPAPLVAGTTYYVVNPAFTPVTGAMTFNVSATYGGAAIAITTTGTGTNSVTPQPVTTTTAGTGNSMYATVQPLVTVTNDGSSTPTSAQVSFAISEIGQGQLYNQVVTLNAASNPPIPAPFTSVVLELPTFTPGLLNGQLGYGIYEDTMIVYNLVPTADQNPADNQLTNEWLCSPANDIKAVSVITPQQGLGAIINVPTPISVRFRNTGVNNQTNVPVSVQVHSPGQPTWYDTVIIRNWPAGSNGGNSDGVTDRSQGPPLAGGGPYYDTAFPVATSNLPMWTPLVQTVDTVFGIAIMYPQNEIALGLPPPYVTDQLALDDTTKSITPILQQYDLAAISVTSPQPGQQEPFGTSWVPIGLFQSVGYNSLFSTDPLRLEVQITRCSDGGLVFVADTTEIALNNDDGQVNFSFPTDQGVWHISTIPPGCYNICMIGHDGFDPNHANDTACSQFSIISRMKGDYFVGVGRQFQTIHQAVDTMQFRGIGGNVRLLLTDAAYHENGTSDVSSIHGAVDLRNIRGLSDTSTVTWIPYTGQTPTITFTGSQASCFYMGDSSSINRIGSGYMNFEGYNPRTAPTPDKIVAEPAKRQLTIVDSESAAGPVFGIEWGAHSITMKDLILHGNGNITESGAPIFSNDSSSVIRMYNEHNLLIYAQGVHDTVEINHIVVNNCELGNAKYGIYDHGLHDQYNAQTGKWQVWRNHDNVFTRNTIGTATNPLSYAGIQFNSETGIVISHNEVSNITSAKGGLTAKPWNVFGIEQPNVATWIGPQGAPVWPGDTGNVTGAWINANRVRFLTSQLGNTYGIAIQQAATQYTSAGLTSVKSTLPVPTQNRLTNNMILDLWTGSGQTYPILMNTAAATYSTDLDSVFNNSISTVNATANVTIQYEKHVFLWDNIIQNTSAGPYTNYWLEVPRPYASSISSDYNLFDLRGTNNFDSVIEYDPRYGTVDQRVYFRRLNDWRTYVNEDTHSLTGDPLFATPAMGTDSLHMPPALTYLESPAANNGIWLGTATQGKDFDGNSRFGNQATDIGAQEWDAFQYGNDLAVLEIVQPAGFSQTSDTSLVTTASPLWINAVVKNLGSVGVYNVPVTATVQRSVRGVWTTVFTANSLPLTWQVNEAKNVVFQGPALTALNDTGVFQVIVTVPNDQNNANDTLSKPFRILLKQNAVLVSYNGATNAGIYNMDSVELALNRLGVPFDTIDRNAPKGLPNSTTIDYTPWWTIVWSMGTPSQPFTNTDGGPIGPGQGALTLQETDEVTRYLAAGLSYGKKSLVIAGQNVANYAFGQVNANVNGALGNTVTDTSWLQTTMHTQYWFNSPLTLGGTYYGRVVGQQAAYWFSSDSIGCVSPDAIGPMLATPSVGPVVNAFAYKYGTANPASAMQPDSGAGVSYYDNLTNTVFYGFDWSNLYQTPPNNVNQNALTSGTTRALASAFAFIASHNGIILPVQFVSENAVHADANAIVTWEVADQDAVAQYDIEKQGPMAADQPSWTTIGHVNAVENQTDYAYTDANIDVTHPQTYRIAAVDASGAKTYSNTVELGPDPSELGFTLGQSYPNPTSGLAEISFTLPVASQVTLRVMDVTGRVVNSDVTNVPYEAGPQNVKLDLRVLPSGSYFYELIASGTDGQSATLSKKLTIEKQ